jgi:hypothetical protein
VAWCSSKWSDSGPILKKIGALGQVAYSFKQMGTATPRILKSWNPGTLFRIK